MAVASRRTVARANKPKGFSPADFTPEGQSRTVKVKFPKGTLEMTIDTTDLTLEFSEQMEQAADEKRLTKMQDLVFGQVSEWDMIDPETGETMELKPERWRKIHPQMFFKILEAFNEQVGNPKEETSS